MLNQRLRYTVSKLRSLVHTLRILVLDPFGSRNLPLSDNLEAALFVLTVNRIPISEYKSLLNYSHRPTAKITQVLAVLLDVESYNSSWGSHCFHLQCSGQRVCCG